MPLWAFIVVAVPAALSLGAAAVQWDHLGSSAKVVLVLALVTYAAGWLRHTHLHGIVLVGLAGVFAPTGLAFILNLATLVSATAAVLASRSPTSDRR